MDPWQYTFPPVTAQAWRDKILAELKGKSIESLHREWWNGEPLLPFHHKENSPAEIIRLPDFLFDRPPVLIEWIETDHKTDKAIYAEVMEALKYGAEEIIFNSREFHPNAPGIWLKDVDTSIVSVRLQQFLENSDQYSWRLYFEEGKDLSEMQTVPVYSLNAAGNFVKNASSLFLFLLNSASDRETKHIYIMYHPCPDYLLTVIQLRVLQILRLNLLKRWNMNPDHEALSIECHIINENGLSPDRYLLKVSVNSLAAAVTGIRALCIHPLQGDNISNFYRRITRNAHHLLHYESEIYRGTDPLAGAYAIDYYTKRWTEAIWSEISK